MHEFPLRNLRIFHVKNESNNAEYHFYDKNGNELLEHTPEGLATAWKGTVSGLAKKTDDKFYAYATFHDDQIHVTTNLTWCREDVPQTLLGKSGKKNTAIALSNPDNLVVWNGEDKSIWNHVDVSNSYKLNAYNDWFIPSAEELDFLSKYIDNDNEQVLKEILKFTHESGIIWSSNTLEDSESAVVYNFLEKDSYGERRYPSLIYNEGGLIGSILVRSF